MCVSPGLVFSTAVSLHQVSQTARDISDDDKLGRASVVWQGVGLPELSGVLQMKALILHILGILPELLDCTWYVL